jgi:broad specificity phosphatase PhoE
VALIDVDLVLVSPLRRALHTCSIVFEKHKSNAPIIVEPAFREIMESSNDLGTEIEDSRQRYPSFDFSHIKHNDWYVDTLSHESDREQITQKL